MDLRGSARTGVSEYEYVHMYLAACLLTGGCSAFPTTDSEKIQCLINLIIDWPFDSAIILRIYLRIPLPISPRLSGLLSGLNQAGLVISSPSWLFSSDVFPPTFVPNCLPTPLTFFFFLQKILLLIAGESTSPQTSMWWVWFGVWIIRQIIIMFLDQIKPRIGSI